VIDRFDAAVTPRAPDPPIASALGAARRASVTYLSLGDDPKLDNVRNREEITAGVVVGLLPSLSLRAQFRRNLEKDRDIWHKYGFVYRHPCLELVGGVEQRYTANGDAGDDTTFSIRVTFTNLGEIAADSGLLGPFGN
jgi:hypothetical protein